MENMNPGCKRLREFFCQRKHPVANNFALLLSFPCVAIAPDIMKKKQHVEQLQEFKRRGHTMYSYKIRGKSE